MNINPIEVKGNWDKGYVLDQHVIKSVYIGDNAYGRPEFETERTELGELVFLFKNRNKYDCLNGIIDLIVPFIDEWVDLKDVNIVLPVPPTKQRIYQPAAEIAEAIAEHLNVHYFDEVLENISSVQAKNRSKDDRSMDGKILAKLKATKPHTILLVDDLFRTGSTLNECVNVLKDDPYLQKVYVLAMTKTKGEAE